MSGHAWFHLQGIHRAVRNGKHAKNQIENICLRRESNQRLLVLQSDALERLTTGIDVLLCLKVSQYSEVTGNAGTSHNSGKNQQAAIQQWL